MKKIAAYVAAMTLTMTAASVVGTRPVSADDPIANMNGTQAEAMLEKAVSTKISASLTGNVDKDFATIMMAHEKVG